MRAVVDQDLCTGCELCTEICPGVFKMDGDLAVAYVDPVPAALETNCREAADSCPVAAIGLDG